MYIYVVILLMLSATFIDNIDATELRGRDSLQYACRLLEVWPVLI